MCKTSQTKKNKKYEKSFFDSSTKNSKGSNETGKTIEKKRRN